VIPRRPFGRTGRESSRVVFGAAALARVDQERADRLLPLLLEYGVNHLDVAASYGDAELRLAPWLRAHPGEFFLATKTGERSGDAARAQLEASLSRLGVDHVDLIQLHNLVEPDEWSLAFGPGGAVAAMAQARDEGLVRFIGVTGHGLRIAGMHLRSLAEFDFDSVLFPYNYSLLSIPSYRDDVEALLDVCASRNVAALTIKSVARRRWASLEARTEARGKSWYEPLTDPDAIERAVQYVLSDDRVFVASSSDFGLLRATLDAASGSSARPADEEMARDIDVYEVSALFDGAELERI
jgi:aryl-alcohol dehydrogenase-like predicted oxidoreductase